MNSLSIALLSAALLGTVLPTGAWAGASGLAPHRAVYDMNLGEAEGQSGISALSGRMVYDFSGNACDGYSVSFRFVTEFQDVSGGSQVTDLQTTSFEGGDAKLYEFLSKIFVNRKLVESTRGTAKQLSNNKEIDLSEPEERTFSIGSKALFPTEHLNKVIESAKVGTPFYAADVYDGSETGDKVFSTTAVIGALRQSPKDASASAGALLEPLTGVSHWPVTIAYFDPAANETSGEQMPIYQLTFLLYENGVSRELVLDYGDFSMTGELNELEFYEASDCNK